MEARRKAPSIVFIDEIDSFCRVRTDAEDESSRRWEQYPDLCLSLL
jgi:SpoVK/Ycf46/Vps4 family AAA+-type ATPase